MDELSVLALTVFFLLASIFLYSWKFKNSKAQKPPLPPGPRGLPILGYLPFLNPNLHLQFTQLAHKYGPVYKLWLGSQLSVVISSPSLIKEVVRDHDTIFANHDPSVAGIVATGGLDIVWSPYGKYWRDMRKLFAREMLSNNNLQASYGLRREEVRRVIGDIVNTKIGKPIEIGEFVFRTELNVIMSLLWGGMIDQEERDRLGAEFRARISKVVDLMGKPNVSDFFPDARMKIMTAGDENKDESRKDFLGVQLELKEQEVGKTSSFGLTQIKAILLDMVIGATDTTSTTIEWVLAELLDNPGAMEKAQQELTHVVGMNNIVQESHISKLHYLEAVVKETFRLHPALPLLLPRMPSESRIIGGYTIPKDSKVFLNTWSIYRDPQVWEDPLQFKPDRFLNDDTESRDPNDNINPRMNWRDPTSSWVGFFASVLSILNPYPRCSNDYGTTRHGLSFKSLGNNTVLFMFHNIVDMKKVLNGSPWLFDESLFALAEACASQIGSKLEVSTCQFWLQVHDLPIGLMNKSFGNPQ
ncbi:hypothetical protein DH2020_047278 [Rehmannia glutinosa]|uniref:DUF4283 domain-containing protein n=1 Tax=Rehmannia glutinosa TaxID=99300 RepID=A0ABR0U9L2_REHGL